jgi:hypothetical protein
MAITERSRTWQEEVALAEHHRALGYTRVCLFDAPIDGHPWDFATVCEDGGSSVKFKAEHPSGLTFEWWIDLWQKDDRGRLDAENVERVLPMLRGEVLVAFIAEVERRATHEREYALGRRREAQELLDATEGVLAVLAASQAEVRGGGE